MRLCELMQRERASILALVADKLRRHHPGVAEPELRNELARFYDELVAALGGATRRHEAARPNLNDTSTTHGDQRHDLVFDPASIVHDYGIVCDSLYTVARRAGLAIDPVEAQTVNRLVDKAAADAITAFWQRDKEGARERHNLRLGTLAHELRNATHAARMAFELIEAGHAPLRGRTATVARSAFARMEQLVEDALAMTRAAAMTPPLQRTRFMLLPLLDEIGDMACGCDVRVRVDADPELEIDADRRLLTSAVSNLVQNAVKFTRAGGQVSLRAREEGIVVAIEVEDECGGLPAGTADDLFRPFVQRSADRSGVGLGLAIVRESIEAHGGHVHVHNLPGKGCVFKVELPALSTRTLPSFVASMSSP